MYEAEIRRVFSENIRRLLREKRLSQKELSERLHVTNVQVSRWATGKCPPSWEMVMGICSALEVGIADLFSNERAIANEVSEINRQEFELFKEFRKFQQAYTKAS